MKAVDEMPARHTAISQVRLFLVCFFRSSCGLI
jgi:hypothetical protein